MHAYHQVQARRTMGLFWVSIWVFPFGWWVGEILQRWRRTAWMFIKLNFFFTEVYRSIIDTGTTFVLFWYLSRKKTHWKDVLSLIYFHLPVPSGMIACQGYCISSLSCALSPSLGSYNLIFSDPFFNACREDNGLRCYSFTPTSLSLEKKNKG